ncbi:MAG: hypothetical protein GTO23_08270 [Nitrososphaeria archaeon]|nr:hypothetical protein [Nitrososphaeria archaeon]
MAILITTSRRPTRRVRVLAKELKRVIPHSTRIQRGKSSLRKLVDVMVSEGFDRLLLIETRRGNPGGLVFYHLVDNHLTRRATLHLIGVSLQLDKKIRFHSSVLDVEIDKGTPSLRQLGLIQGFLAEFLKDVYYHQPRGRPCTLMISHDGENFVLEFRDADRGVPMNPTLKVGGVKWQDESS